MRNAKFGFVPPQNEPIKGYLPGSPEKAGLKAKLEELKSQQIDIPLIIGGKKIYTDKTTDFVSPQNHSMVLGKVSMAEEEHIQAAVDSCVEAQKEWAAMAWQDRASIFMKAAELLAGPYRAKLNAATMLGQGKTAYQAEIDSACELIDFLRFNVYYTQQIYEGQPLHSPAGIWNRLDYRPLEGFIYAITPFNFTAIGGNLPTSPAMLGNVAIWKPSINAVYSNYFFMEILMEAGLPPGVINFITGKSTMISDVIMKSKHFTGIHFTGSTPVFQSFWKTIGENIHNYKSYPRVVGETGGKDFIFAHESADLKALGTAIIRGAFEYQGQKCSAASRAYIPESLWPELKDFLLNDMAKIKVGEVEDFSNFMGPVISKKAFNDIKAYIDYAKESEEAEIIFGGKCDDSVGYFIEPTIVLTSNPKFKTMEEEIFGPVMTLYVYKDAEYEATLQLCDETSPYALTGAVFANDRRAITKAEELLINAAGNFYINDKPTGAVVGQQPFGGARGSGTNDKAGSYLNLMRWLSVRSVKENFNPPTSFEYPYMSEK